MSAIDTKQSIIIDRIFEHVNDELVSALTKHPSMHSAHEGYSVILEEMDELKEEVWKRQSKRNMERMREEAVQVAAMAIRFILDVCDQ